MFKRILLSSAFVVAGGLAAPMVMANTGEEHAGGDMAGKQTIENKEQFKQLDTDGNGFLSQQELAAAQDIPVEHSTLDTNNDNQVDQTEFAAMEKAGQTGQTGMGQSQTDTGMGQSDTGMGQEDDPMGGASDEWGTEDEEYESDY